ncbi:MAG: sigma 54-interacting transcriptional regulator [Deltaproteobacteria bacterium]|nr:sigma 54-interacting transcriptional regulator [Deltaproteobacteria bacterium]
MQKNSQSDITADFFTGSILLVDDDKMVLATLERYLASMGYPFVSVTEGQKAIELLNSEHFDIVISDIQMPRPDGIQLLRHIKKEHAGIDVILMTGYSQAYTFTDVIREGATDYLEKPFTGDAVRAKIFRILKERALLAEFSREFAQRREVEKNLREKSRELEKRVRELNCLYHVSDIIEQKKDRLDDIFQETLKTIPPALQFPEIAVARLRHGGRTYCTPDFQQTSWSLVTPIKSRGREVGSIEVCYTRQAAGYPGMVFQEEEHALLNEIAEKMGRAIDSRRAEEELLHSFANLEETVRLRTQELHEAQTALESVFQNIPDGVLSVNEEMVVTHFNERCMRNLDVAIGKVFPARGSKFQDECYRVLKNTLNAHEAVIDYRIEIRNGEQIRQVVLVSTSLLNDEANRTAGALLIIHDITRLADLENQLQERRRFRQLIGNCPQLQEIFSNVRKLASVDTTVLITGESGTGKELLVETLHASGNRSVKPLIKVNCAALPENLLESELFGHVRGAFTGAVKDRTGRIQAAEGGILLLDEIGDISPRIQLKLLRFLEVKEYERVGESQTRRADVRVFAATNADLARKVQEGLFREDLYYRLKVMVIHLPPLRERREDIPALIDHFLAFFNKKFHKSISAIAKEVQGVLLSYDWPGNVRELKHVVEHAVLLSSGPELQPEHLPKDLFATGRAEAQDRQPARALTRESLLSALRQTDGNKAKTARMLKLSRATLYNKIKEFNLQHEDGSDLP